MIIPRKKLQEVESRTWTDGFCQAVWQVLGCIYYSLNFRWNLNNCILEKDNHRTCFKLWEYCLYIWLYLVFLWNLKQGHQLLQEYCDTSDSNTKFQLVVWPVACEQEKLPVYVVSRIMKYVVLNGSYSSDTTYVDSVSIGKSSPPQVTICGKLW